MIQKSLKHFRYNYKKKATRPAPWRAAFPEQQAPAAEKRPRRIRSRTPERAREEREYAKLARASVKADVDAGKTCPVVAAVPELRDGFKYGHPISARLTENHHIYGRDGDMLLARWGWMSISKQGHRWVHAHKEEARALGFYAPIGCWNNRGAAYRHWVGSGDRRLTVVGVCKGCGCDVDPSGEHCGECLCEEEIP